MRVSVVVCRLKSIQDRHKIYWGNDNKITAEISPVPIISIIIAFCSAFSDFENDCKMYNH